jgi:hypothetical protein
MLRPTNWWQKPLAWRLWGQRNSCAVPGSAASKYGLEASCPLFRSLPQPVVNRNAVIVCKTRFLPHISQCIIHQHPAIHGYMKSTLWRRSAVNKLAIYVARAYGQQSVSIQSAVPTLVVCYRGADKFLARPGKKQATATEDSEFHISYL